MPLAWCFPPLKLHPQHSSYKATAIQFGKSTSFLVTQKRVHLSLLSGSRYASSGTLGFLILSLKFPPVGRGCLFVP